MRVRRAGRITARLPRDAAGIEEVAVRVGLTIPPDCMQGVVANLELLDRHLGIIRGSGAA